MTNPTAALFPGFFDQGLAASDPELFKSITDELARQQEIGRAHV